MSRKQVTKSLQINSTLSLIEDYDQPITKSKEILEILNSCLNNRCQIEKYINHVIYSYTHDNQKEIFLINSITYLSNPHPIYKKRCQLKKWQQEYYNKNKHLYKIHLLGLYHYEGVIVFVDFDIADYNSKNWNSSSAHVYINDIYHAITEGIFTKIDMKGNHIYCIVSHQFQKYLNSQINNNNNSLTVFQEFNALFPFNQWLKSNVCIEEMKDNNWSKWKETEWAGWWLEYQFSKFLNENEYNNIIVYAPHNINPNMLDFDLFFVDKKFYGDLKASDISKSQVPGNDKNAICEAINKGGKLWYVIYEHETVLDKNQNNEMAINRMELLGYQYSPGDKISYASRMKHSVNFKRMIILELNRINLYDIVSTFNQGRQPNGTSRNPKFLINKKNIDNYIIYSYCVK